MNQKIILILFLMLLLPYLLKLLFLEKFASTKKIKISVVLMLKNNECYSNKLEELFSELEQDKKYKFKYFIYENNSNDRTKQNILKFLKNRKGIMILENKVKPKNFESVVSQSRGAFMSELRNKLKYYHGKLDSKYTLY